MQIYEAEAEHPLPTMVTQNSDSVPCTCFSPALSNIPIPIIPTILRYLRRQQFSHNRPSLAINTAFYSRSFTTSREHQEKIEFLCRVENG